MTDLKAPQARKADGDIGPVFLASPYGYYRDEESISLLDIARALRSEWRLMTAIVVLAGLISLASAFSATPVYRAEVLLAPVSASRHEGIAPLIGELGGLSTLLEGYIGANKDRTTEYIAALRSRTVASNFIREHNLKPHLFPDRWNSTSQQWSGPRGMPTDFEAYEVFDTQVRAVNVDRRTRLVSLAMEWRDPALAAKWANDFVIAINERQRAEAIQEAQQSIKYLQQQLARNSSVETRQAIYSLIEMQTKTTALANARAEYAFKVIDPAVIPERRIRPRRTVMVAVGVVFGIVLAVAVVLGRRALRGQPGRADPLV